MIRYQCSHPECDHIGDILTSYHCETTHDMTKKEIIEHFGEPRAIKFYSNYKQNRNAFNEQIHKKRFSRVYGTNYKSVNNYYQ